MSVLPDPDNAPIDDESLGEILNDSLRELGMDPDAVDTNTKRELRSELLREIRRDYQEASSPVEVEDQAKVVSDDNVELESYLDDLLGDLDGTVARAESGKPPADPPGPVEPILIGDECLATTLRIERPPFGELGNTPLSQPKGQTKQEDLASAPSPFDFRVEPSFPYSTSTIPIIKRDIRELDLNLQPQSSDRDIGLNNEDQGLENGGASGFGQNGVLIWAGLVAALALVGLIALVYLVIRDEGAVSPPRESVIAAIDKTIEEKGEARNPISISQPTISSSANHGRVGFVEKDTKVSSQSTIISPALPRVVPKAKTNAGGSYSSGFSTSFPTHMWTITASSSHPYSIPKHAIDGDRGTRWGTGAVGKPEWLMLDFGQKLQLYGLGIIWEFPKEYVYEVQVSDDALTWKSVATGAGAERRRRHPFSAAAQFLRIYCISVEFKRFSIRELWLLEDSAVSPGIAVVSTSNKSLWRLSVCGEIEAKPAKNLLDGDVTTRWGSGPSGPPFWVVWDLGKLQKINGLQIEWFPNNKYDYDLLTSKDGNAWEPIQEEKGDAWVAIQEEKRKVGIANHYFSTVARYLKIHCEEDYNWISIRELRLLDALPKEMVQEN